MKLCGLDCENSPCNKQKAENNLNISNTIVLIDGQKNLHLEKYRLSGGASALGSGRDPGVLGSSPESGSPQERF